MSFVIPKSIQRDFTALLELLGINAIVNLDPLNVIKVRLDKVNYRTKNNIVSADEVAFAELSSNLKIGDYLQYKNEVFLINQLVTNEFPKCYEISSIACNTKFTVKRFQTAVYDNSGNVITAEGDNPIASNIYCSSLVSGAQFQITSGGAGIIPVDTVTVQTRFTLAETKNIAIGDNFMWFSQKYMIQSLDYSQIDLDGNSGLLGFIGKRIIVDGAVI